MLSGPGTCLVVTLVFFVVGIKSTTLQAELEALPSHRKVRIRCCCCGQIIVGVRVVRRAYAIAHALRVLAAEPVDRQEMPAFRAWVGVDRLESDDWLGIELDSHHFDKRWRNAERSPPLGLGAWDRRLALRCPGKSCRRCPGGKCRWAAVVRTENLARAYLDVVRTGGRDIVLGPS